MSGIDSQLEDCRQYALGRGYEIVGEFNEERNINTSGADWLPGIERVMELADARAFDVLVCREVSRLSRDRLKHLLIKTHLNNRDVAIEYVIGQYDDSAEGQLLEGIMAELAQYEKAQITRRLHGAIRKSVAAGSIKTGGAGVPYGYDLVEVDGRRRLQINDYEADIVRLVFDLYTVGGLSIYAIGRHLEDRNIPKPAKAAAHVAATQAARGLGWSRSTVGGILHNETYTGVWHYRKTRRVKYTGADGKARTKVVPRPRDEWIAVTVPAIIEVSTFELAQMRGETNKRALGKQHWHTYAVGGMLTCGRCGRSMSGVGRGGLDKQGRLRRYYACTTRLTKRKYNATCDNPYFRTDETEAAIWRWVKGVLLSPEALRLALDTFQSEQEAALRPLYRMIESTEARRRELVDKRERLIAGYAAGVLSLDDLATQKTDTEREIAQIDQALGQLRAELAPRLLSDSELMTIEATAASIRRGGDVADTNPALQREIYRLLNMRITLDQSEGERVADLQCLLGVARVSASGGTGSCRGRSSGRAPPGARCACPAQ